MASYGATYDRQSAPDGAPAYKIDCVPAGYADSYSTARSAIIERQRLESCGGPRGFWRVFKLLPSGSIYEVDDDGQIVSDDLR